MCDLIPNIGRVGAEIVCVGTQECVDWVLFIAQCVKNRMNEGNVNKGSIVAGKNIYSF